MASGRGLTVLTDHLRNDLMGSVQLEVVFSIPLFHYHQKPHYYTSSEIADEISELLHYSLSNSVGDLSTSEFSKKSELRPHLSHQVIHLM